MPETIRDARTIWGLLQRRAEVDPDLPLLFDGAGRSLTVGQLEQRALDAAGNLAAAGVREGTVVSWQLPTWIDTVALSLALSRLGAVQNPILHVYREREVRFVLDQLRPALFVVPADFGRHDYAAMARGISAELESPPEILVMGADLFEPNDSPLPPSTDATLGGDAGDREAPVRWIYYTSGTSSAPKGVRHTDETLLAGGRALALALGLGEGDVGSIAFPFTHIAGPDYLVMMLMDGIPAVLLDAFRPAEAIEAFARHGVTVGGGSTAFYAAYLAEQRKRPGEVLIPSLRLLSGGGAPKPPEIFYEVLGEMGVRTVHGYAMTEVPMLAMGRPGDEDEQLANTDGRAVAGAELRVVDPEGSPCPVGVDGEVRVRGTMVCKGYVDEAQTAEAFDADGWFRTGDVGHLRADGHLVITGRIKDIIIRKGENVSAKEVEDLLYTHPQVGAVAVIGLPDPSSGERVCAVVEPSPGAEALSFDQLRRFCREAGLMTQKIPEQLEIVERLPRNETLNKVLKEQLRRQFSAPLPTS
jgi:acyl-CoA synthetase (AMP-forming)/AMP-acid ligase II